MFNFANIGVWSELRECIHCSLGVEVSGAVVYRQPAECRGSSPTPHGGDLVISPFTMGGRAGYLAVMTLLYVLLLSLVLA